MTFKPAQNIISIFLVLVFLSSSVLPSTLNVYAQSVDDYQKELEEKQKEKEEKESYLASVKKEIERIQNSGYSLDYQIQLIEEELEKVKAEMDKLLEDIEEKEIYIAEKEVEIGKKQEKVNEISDKLYRNSRISALDILLRKEGPENVIQSLIFNKFVIASQVAYMKRLAVEMEGLKVEKEKLGVDKVNYEKDQEDFNESKAILAEQKVLLQKQLSAQVNTKGALSKQIGLLDQEITQLQAAIAVARSGQNAVSGEIGLGSGTDYFGGAPSGSFAVFSIGAYTHRDGMSQWGAKARAEVGKQTAQQILKFYYPSASVITRTDLMQSIKVDGYGTIPFEEQYLMGIKEMPESWPLEVLKMQAIAARTFAVSRTSNGVSSICATQDCQVFSLPVKTGAWKQAVEETRGMVLVNSSGNYFTGAYYASTHGGWVNGIGWDTIDGSSDLNKAWDKISGHPWFYSPWYTYNDPNTDAFEYIHCPARDYAWITNEEMADLLNVWLVLFKGEGNSVNGSRILPTTINTCKVSGLTGSPYSLADLRSLLSKPVTQVLGKPTVIQNNQGQTSSITFSTNRGVITVPASDFKYVFNTRAPGYLSIPQSRFTFINIESK